MSYNLRKWDEIHGKCGANVPTLERKLALVYLLLTIIIRIEWVFHVFNESQHGKDSKDGSFSQEGEEEAAGPKPSPGIKERVSSRNPDPFFAGHEKGKEDQPAWGGSLG